jgi:hypothetical protein
MSYDLVELPQNLPAFWGTKDGAPSAVIFGGGEVEIEERSDPFLRQGKPSSLRSSLPSSGKLDEGQRPGGCMHEGVRAAVHRPFLADNCVTLRSGGTHHFALLNYKFCCIEAGSDRRQDR